MNISISFGGLDSEKKPTVRCRKVFLKCSSTSWLHERTRRNESCVVQKCFRNILISLLASYMDIAATTGGVTSPDQPITLAIISSSLYWVHGGFAPLQVHSFHLCEFALSPKKECAQTFTSWPPNRSALSLPQNEFISCQNHVSTNLQFRCEPKQILINVQILSRIY